MSEAEGFLSSLLHTGPVLSTEVEEKALAAGIRESTLKRAKRNLGIEAFKDLGSYGKWYCRLPNKEDQGVQEDQEDTRNLLNFLPPEMDDLEIEN